MKQTDDFLDTIPDETVLESQGQIREWLKIKFGIMQTLGYTTDSTPLMYARAERVYSELKRLQDKDRAVTERAREVRDNYRGYLTEAPQFVYDLASDTFTVKEADAE